MTQLDALSSELQRRDPRFLRILSTNPAEGQGEYELRSATTGKTLRLTFTYEGQRIVTPMFNQEVTARMAAEACRAPDPYEQGLKKLRAAASTPESRFEEQYKAERRAALAAEYARRDP